MPESSGSEGDFVAELFSFTRILRGDVRSEAAVGLVGQMVSSLAEFRRSNARSSRGEGNLAVELLIPTASIRRDDRRYGETGCPAGRVAFPLAKIWRETPMPESRARDGDLVTELLFPTKPVRREDGRGGGAVRSLDSRREPNLPLEYDSLRFAVISDTGALRTPFRVETTRRGLWTLIGLCKVIISAPQVEDVALVFRSSLSSSSSSTSSSAGLGGIRAGTISMRSRKQSTSHVSTWAIHQLEHQT